MAYVAKVKVRYRNDDTGREIQLPGVLTEGGVLISHLRYLASEPTKSASWRERSVFAMRDTSCRVLLQFRCNSAWSYHGQRAHDRCT
ncbi:hypothetical protein BW33_01979 [Pseudomonas sp. RIT288]|jgi:hypothetical protein|nr:hypothetical protein BW33_01979 [Pseudomonas sp. RIT288]